MKNLLLVGITCALNLSGWAQCSNAGFESTAPGSYTAANSISGWTLSSQSITSCTSSTVWTAGSPEFSIMATPLSDPTIGILSTSPFGGSVVAKFHNNSASGLSTSLKQNMLVGTQNSILQFAYAGVWQTGSHNCCEQAAFKVLIKDCAGVLMACHSMSLSPVTATNCTGVPGYSLSNGAYWTNWIIKTIDLTIYTGTCITVEFVNSDCIFADHYGITYLDTRCANSGNVLENNGISIDFGPPSLVSYCLGTNQAFMCAPTGYATYSWYPPGSSAPIPASQASLQCLTVLNPMPGQTYTVLMSNSNGCVYVATYVISFSQVNINSIGSSPSCSMGASGSASVMVSGSGTGYNFIWKNSTNSVVSTSSVAPNLPPGIYSVQVTAIGSANCGTAVSTITVGTRPSTLTVLKPFCGNTAYLNTSGGNNFQWYNGTAAISGTAGGNAASYTVTNAVNNAVYWLSYVTGQGCSDSVKYTLVATQPGSIAVVSGNTICPAASNGSAVISLSATPGPAGLNSFLVFSTGATPSFSANLNPTASNTFVMVNLSGAGTYSIRVFDGSCFYGTNYTVPIHSINFNLSPSGSLSLCPGNSIGVVTNFSATPPPNLYTYTWSPNLFIMGNAVNASQVIITPTVAVGTQSTTIYTVAVTSSVTGCVISKTLGLTAINPVTPTVNAVPDLCAFGSNYTIAATPSGGLFMNNPGVSPGGFINTSIAIAGLNTVTYVTTTGTCQAPSSATFVIKPQPVIWVTGNVNICVGETATLNVFGANSYSWSTGSNSTLIFVTPNSNTNYSVSGTGTNGCTSTITVQVNSTPVPTLSISSPTQICAGSTVTIQANGANSYLWNSGSTDSWAVVSPSSSISYTVTGLNSPQCKSSATVSITVIPNPTILVSGDIEICAGENSELFASGADQYNWSNSSSSHSVNVAPLVNTTYTVVGTTNQAGCTGAATVEVIVNACTGIKDLQPPAAIYFYPNPGTGVFFLESEKINDLNLTNALGQSIGYFRIVKGNNVLDLSQYENGLYYLKIQEGTVYSVYKIIKTP